VALALAGWLLAAAPAAGQAPRNPDRGYLDQVRRLTEVAAQKVEDDVRGAVLEAQRLAASDPARAGERLKKALTALENDTALTAGRRDTLVRMLKDRLRVYQAEADRGADRADRQQQALGRRTEDSQRLSQEERIRQALNHVSGLQREGRTDEANRQAGDLARRYPNNPAVQASGRVSSAADEVASLRSLRFDRERSRVGTLRGVETAATLPGGDMEFPKDWAEKSRLRSKSTIPLTAKEQAIIKALNTTISVNFKDSRFEDVIEYLRTYTGQPILLDEADLKDAQLTYDTPITLQTKGVTVRTLLRKILGEFGLSYVVKEETIQVMSALKAKETMVTRSYYLGDLVALAGPLSGLQWGPFLNQAQTWQNIVQLIDLIQNTVDPQSWQSKGGSGTITFHAPSMSLVVKQSAEVHYMLGSGLLR
jgi:hypothetical protein